MVTPAMAARRVVGMMARQIIPAQRPGGGENAAFAEFPQWGAPGIGGLPPCGAIAAATFRHPTAPR
jgi:hypothetical protein